ncbi:MAG: transcriptional regulator [Sphaerochaetaceae bacterium]|nr:transcriptional regulator [Sphaerochaetaceae bacterium]MDC7236307.1 transcriptional regulator [Sphaerochaetaceae bacterium]MDC7249343.1 transcriptional regulator [Sphaerochaetaceae bacterium]
MGDYNISAQTEENFEKAKNRARIQVILSKLKWENSDLLSLYEVTELIKPRGQSYLGVKSIPIKDIIGSEGRARDFSKAFYPKKELLKERWKSIDKAHLQFIDLPSISVYKLGQWYFVRDGNHRVSVAKSQGSEFIDAEIVELDSQIPLKKGMTMRDLRKKVIDFERNEFLNQYNFKDIIPIDEIVFSATGMYSEVLNHIYVHKYYMNEKTDKEIPFDRAVKSWYKNVYFPIIDECRKLKLLTSFPGNTEGDLYIWIVRHWDDLKNMSGSQNVSIESAALDYKQRFAKGYWYRFFKRIGDFLFKK